MHILIDGYTKHTGFLQDKRLISNLLIEAVNLTGMIIVGGPHLKSFGKGYGITGTTTIKESHFSIHTWPEIGGFQMDAFSCHDFEIKPFVSLICQRARLTRGECLVMDRGILEGELVYPRIRYIVNLITAGFI